MRGGHGRPGTEEAEAGGVKAGGGAGGGGGGPKPGRGPRRGGGPGRVGGGTVPRGRPGTTAIGEDEVARCRTVGHAGAADRGRGGGGAVPRGRGGRARPQPEEDEAAVYRAAVEAATRGRREEAVQGRREEAAQEDSN
jgi:translation initiation factor IF-2